MGQNKTLSPTLAAAILACVTVAAYATSLRGAFVFDDQSSVLENPSIRALWPLGPVLFPPADAGICGRPFANFTMALDYAVSGTNPWSYHVGNLAIHIAAALALFGVLRRTLTSLSGQPSAFSSQLPSASALSTLNSQLSTPISSATPTALAASALWALHPLCTNAVDYVSQRQEALMGLCYLATLYAFIRSAESARPSTLNPQLSTTLPLWPALTVVTCLLGMASKEVMITAPVMILLYDRTFLAGSFAAALRARWRLHAALAATWIFLGWLMLNASLSHRGIGYSLGVSTLDYALNEARILLRYLRLAVWPSPLVFDYGWDFDWSPRIVIPCVTAIAALLVATVVALIRAPKIGFLLAWFFVVISPASSIVPIIQQPAAESRAYLPLAAITTLLAFAIYALFRKFLTTDDTDAHGSILPTAPLVSAETAPVSSPSDIRVHPRNPWLKSSKETSRKTSPPAAAPRSTSPTHPRSLLPFLACLTVALVFAVLTIRRHAAYATPVSLWTDTVTKRPENPRAHNNLGSALLATGDLPAALAHFDRAVALKPSFADARNNLGATLLRSARPADALPHLTEAIRLQPDLAQAHSNLGNALLTLGRPTDALAAFTTAVTLRPTDAHAHNNLSVVTLALGRPADSLAAAETAVRLNPAFAEARYNLGNALAASARPTDAAAQFRESIRLNPAFAKPHHNLGVLFLRANQLDAAIAEFREALRLDPAYTSARQNLETALRAQKSN